MAISIHTIVFALFALAVPVLLTTALVLLLRKGLKWSRSKTTVTVLVFSGAFVFLMFKQFFDFAESVKSNAVKIDAFEYYAGTAEAQGKSYDAGGAHLCYFLGWAIENDLVTKGFGFYDPKNASKPLIMGKEAEEVIAKFKKQGPESIELLIAYSEWLVSTMLTPKASEFAISRFQDYTQEYFDLMKQHYGREIQEISVKNYKLAKDILDKMYSNHVAAKQVSS